MVYVEKISSLEEIDTMPVLEIQHEHWETIKHIRSYAQMGIYQQKEWVVKFTVFEKNPLRTYTQYNDPVYLDSAVEFFINLEPEESAPRYINFEINANGAFLVGFGAKNNRIRLQQSMAEPICCTTLVDEEKWSVMLRVPLDLIFEVYGKTITSSNVPFSFNLYKISETKEYEHYITYAQIEHPRPDFHLPQFFAEGVVKL